MAGDNSPVPSDSVAGLSAKVLITSPQARPGGGAK